MRGRGLPLAALAACIGTVLAASPSAAAQEVAAIPTPPPTPTESALAAPAVVKVERIVPKRRKVVRSRFTPWAKPSPAKVRRIIRLEARRWHISPWGLTRRIDCESNFQWWANGGSYYGLLQFAPSTFYRGMSSIKTRRVTIVRKSVRKLREIKITHYSDASVVRERGGKHRQRVLHVRSGSIPRRPGITHAWAQVRIGAQAIRGVSAVSSSEWGCPE